MKTKRFLLVAIYVAITFTFFACSTGDPTGGNNNNNSSNPSEIPNSNSGGNSPTPTPPSSEQCAGYCKWTDGCFIISTDPTGQYGTVTSSCAQAISNCQTNGQFFSNSTCSGSNNNPTPPSTSAPNALEITLTKYEELASLDPIGYGDPRVSFRVRAYRQGTIFNDETTGLLLNQDDIRIWTGSAKATVTISDLADKVDVYPIVKDADATFDDDVSPDGYSLTGFTNGTTHNLESRNSKVSVTYSLRFIRR